jgi:hypothetical protein
MLASVDTQMLRACVDFSFDFVCMYGSFFACSIIVRQLLEWRFLRLLLVLAKHLA